MMITPTPILLGIDKFKRILKPKTKKGFTDIPYSYGHLLKEYGPEWDGWVAVDKALPFPYDLVNMDINTKIIPGWWTGTSWDGLRLKEADIVRAWTPFEAAS